jgi:ATP/maltotriose-dependent transcriptional regulator MalT
MIPVLLTKVTLPHRREDLLARQRLIDLLDDLLDHKLIVVTAPAGYGKTSLLVDVAYRHEFPFCWYALGPTDGEIQSFLAHFITAIEQKFPQFGEQSKGALQAMGQGNLSLEHFTVTLVNEVYRSVREHFVIVLDDYHLVKDSEAVNQFINRFIQGADQNCHLVILSRSLISLADLPLMVARSQVSGVGLHELAFRADEIKSLILQNYHQVIPDSIAVELAQKTEGWITGLLLSAQTMWEGMVDRLRASSASGVGLYDYLVNQVLDHQPPELREFLLQTSYLEEFNAELCEAVLGAPPPPYTWQGMLEQILSHNLFVLPVEREGLWLRYHHLFRDFLQNRLAQEQPEEADRLLRLLIKVRSERQEWELAYTTCLTLGDIETTADLLEQAGEAIVRSGRTTLLGKWLEALPAGVIEQRPMLLARQGIVLTTQGDTERGLRLLDRAVAHFTTLQDRTHLAGALVWRALTHFIRSNYTDSIADATKVLSLLDTDTDREEQIRFRAEACRVLGQDYRLLGKLEEAIHYLSQALSIFQGQADPRGINLILLSLGAAYVEAGDFEEALSCYRRGLEYYQKRGDTFWLAAVLNDLACVYHLRGEYAKAFTTFEDGLDKAKESGNARVQVMILIGLGDLFIDLDAPEAAAEAYFQAREPVERSKDHYLLTYLHLAEVAVTRLSGNIPKAHLLLKATELLSLHMQSNYVRGLYLLEAGRLALARNDHQGARALLTEAADLFEGGGQRVHAGRANLLLAAACCDRGDTAAIANHFEKALCLVSGLGSQHLLVSSARWVKPLLSLPDLPPLVGQQAQHLLEQVERFEDALPLLKRSLRFQKLTVPISPSRLRIQALGAAQVTIDGRPVTSADWQTQVTRDLLYLVVSKPPGWSKEALGEVLWPDSSPAQLKNRFKNTLYRLRRALQQDVVVFDGDRYVFNRELDYEYDVESFLELLAQARNAPTDEARQSAYQKLIELYQGEYLPEVIARPPAATKWLSLRGVLCRSNPLAGQETASQRTLAVTSRKICADRANVER